MEIPNMIEKQKKSWCLSAYPKGIQDVGVFVSCCFTTDRRRISALSPPISQMDHYILAASPFKYYPS